MGDSNIVWMGIWRKVDIVDGDLPVFAISEEQSASNGPSFEAITDNAKGGFNDAKWHPLFATEGEANEYIKTLNVWPRKRVVELFFNKPIAAK